MINIDWKPDKTSSIPLYKQIIEYIKLKIKSGEWPIKSKIPPERNLAEKFEVSRSTITYALDELKSEGLIEGKGKSGTIVINNTWSILASTFLSDWGNYVKYGIHKPNLQTIQIINNKEFENGIIRLGTGEPSPDLFPHKMMEQVLKNVSQKIFSLGYEEPKGSLALRQAIANYIKKFGIVVSPSSILIVSGSLDALGLISMSILQPGSTVLTEKPSYLKSLEVFQSLGMRLKGISMDKNGLILNELNYSIDKNCSLLYTIPTFHNPTGIIMPDKRREELLKICELKRLPILEDDAYRELYIDEVPPLPLKAKDKNGMVLYMGTVSKSLFPGIRIGWLIGPESVIDRLSDIKMQTDYGASSISQAVLTEWMESGLYEKYLIYLRDQLRYRRDTALSTLDKYFSDIAEWEKPSGGFYIWLKLKKSISMKKLFSACLKNKILINPGYIYDFNKNSNIRISYSYASISQIKYGLKKLSEIIKFWHE